MPWASSCSPCLSPGHGLSAVLYGALFGFCVYAAYDLTNLATLRGWSLTVSLVDLAWGAAVTAAPLPSPSWRCAASRGSMVVVVFGMTPHESDDEAAGRHDLEAALARIVERGADQARTDALAFVGRRHLRVGEDQPIALLAIDGDGETMLGIELVAALGCVVSDTVCISGRPPRTSGRTIGSVP